MDYNKKVSWAPNQHIRMTSEGSCDTEDWSSALQSQKLNYILKYIKIEISWNPVMKNRIYCIMRNVTEFAKFWINQKFNSKHDMDQCLWILSHKNTI